MRLWRLTRAAHARDPLSGEGAARVGNRWNLPGTRMAYAATSRPLAMLEMLVHVDRRLFPDDLRLIGLDVPDTLIAEATALPADWNELPFSSASQQFGTEWVKQSGSLGLLVPSVVIPAEFNLIVNPLHPAFNRIKVQAPEDFRLDPRLFPPSPSVSRRK